MEVTKEEASYVEHEGQTYCFCGKSCKEELVKEPGKYLQTSKEE